jgi:putative oxidoreductase
MNDMAQLFARLAVGFGFLSAVADRFGLWGAPGSRDVAWGSFPQFIAYTASVNSFLPASWAPSLAVGSTLFELAFGICLVLGIRTRWMAIGSGALLAIFALAMTVSFGVKKPLDFSVFAASSAAFMLATALRYRWSLDEVFAPKSDRLTP